MGERGLWCTGAVAGATLVGVVSTAASAQTQLSDLDLTRAFATRTPWRLVVTQDPPVSDPTGEEDRVPGPVHLCLRREGAPACDPSLSNDMRRSGPRDDSSDPHELRSAAVVRPRGVAQPPLLVVATGSVRSVDGGQLLLTQALAYRPEGDRFAQVLRTTTGSNNNQETRYIASGRLRGDIISVEPTENAPFVYWVTVNALTPAYTYKQVLRYRSVTRYNGGNALAVIDSEMPNIQRRLGVWRLGEPLPLPEKGCAKPLLVRTELWCE